MFITEFIKHSIDECQTRQPLNFHHLILLYLQSILIIPQHAHMFYVWTFRPFQLQEKYVYTTSSQAKCSHYKDLQMSLFQD